jgi:hypothetical protein
VRLLKGHDVKDLHHLFLRENPVKHRVGMPDVHPEKVIIPEAEPFPVTCL